MFYKTIKKNQEEESPNYVGKAISAIIILAIVKCFWPKFLPFDVFSFWSTKGSLTDWFTTGGWFLAWGALLFTFMYFRKRSSISYVELRHTTPTSLLQRGFVISLKAGILEEIIFRWLVFLGGIITVRIADFILGGFIFDHGLYYPT